MNAILLIFCGYIHLGNALNRRISIGVVTDVHIGESCNGDLSFDGCKPVRALTDAVAKMNTLNLDGVFVTGDITASAITSEFEKAREILENSVSPWWPLFGNHDSWPYTRHDGTFNQTDTPIGDQVFAEVYGDILDGSFRTMNETQALRYAHARIKGWPVKSCLNQDYKTFDSWFHNFEVSFPEFSSSFKFLNLDWVSRGAALPEPGVGPEVELHDFECGTTDWLENALGNSSANSQFFIFQHHPFHNWDILDPFGHNLAYNFTFDDKQDKRVQEILQKHFPPSSFLGSHAGHNHRWFDGSAFTKFTASSDEWLVMPAWETPATKGWFFDADFVSSFTVFTFQADDSLLGPHANDHKVHLSNVVGMWKTAEGNWMLKPIKSDQ